MSVLRMNPPLADLLTLTCCQVRRGPKAETLSWGRCWSCSQKWPPFCRGHPTCQTMRTEKSCLEPAVLNFAEWVSWKVARCDTPSWWMELSTVLGENNTRRLAREVRASFQLPWQMHELESKEAPFQAPWHCHAFTGEDSCLRSFLFLPAGISGRSPRRRP